MLFLKCARLPFVRYCKKVSYIANVSLIALSSHRTLLMNVFYANVRCVTVSLVIHHYSYAHFATIVHLTLIPKLVKSVINYQRTVTLMRHSQRHCEHKSTNSSCRKKLQKIVCICTLLCAYFAVLVDS